MIENSIVYRNFRGKYEYFALSHAKGSLIWNRDGKQYIDFSSGWNVTNLGWNHPEIRDAVIEQAHKNVQGLLWGSDPIQEEYAATLTQALPQGLDACIKVTGGTEWIEVSLKVARIYTQRKKIIGFSEHYHGQLFASLALGASNGHKKLAPLVPDIVSIDFPDSSLSLEAIELFEKQLEETLSHEDIAAIVTEPGIITGWGSTRIAYHGFLSYLRKVTQKYGTLLIVDEVGTGFSRTGKLFAIEHENVTPDMIVLAKGISNGAGAIGSVVGKSPIFESAFDDAILVSTFGWTPLGCAAALKTLQIHIRDAMWEAAQEKGQYIIERLRPFIGDTVVHVQGKWLEIGVRFKDATICSNIQKAAFASGLHVVVGSKENMQIMPPLTIPTNLLTEGLDILTAEITRY